MDVAGFFSGVGGIELGFQQAGFDIKYSNEIDTKAATTFNLNFNHEVVVDDIHNIDSKDIPDVDVIVGGFPCQAFSIAGYRKGFEDKRGEVFFQLARIIKNKLPRIVFIENVKNLLSHDNGNTYRVISETLESYGYSIIPLILNACDFGNVPQNRERIYIIGFRNEDDYKNFKCLKPIPLSTKISDIVNYSKKVDESYYYTRERYQCYEKLVEEMTDPNSIYQWRRVYVRRNKSYLCPTLTANMGTGGHNVPLVLTQYGIRKLTPKECFQFQGYPKDFKLPDFANSHLYKQAGNSVVVPVIFRLAKAIKLAVEKTNKENLK